MRVRGILATLSVGVLGAGLFAIPAATATNGPAAGPGCDPSRSAVAHHASGAVLDPQPIGAPIPCLTFTGQTTDTAEIGVTRSGAVFYAPIAQLDRTATPPTVPGPSLPGGVGPSAVETPFLPSIVARSTNLGAYWQRVVPSPLPLPVSPHGSVIPWLSVDPETSRVWYATPVPCGPNLGVSISSSDDDGATWNQSFVDCPTQGANALIEGPAPAGGAQPSGYPHVVYYCANAGEVPLGTHDFILCRKSLDGGRTFDPVPVSSPDSVPARAECGGPTGYGAETRVGTVGKDGVLYFPQDVCGQGQELGLAVSRDEGATWEHKVVAHTTIQDLYPPTITADQNNNLYLVWKGAGGLPYLTVSRDAGDTWSTPIEVGAPGVTGIRRVAISARDLGHIDISYLGSTDGGGTFNAYITESRDALDADPVFWSAPVNDPAQPVGSSSETQAVGDRIQGLNNMIGPDGTPWAAFHCAYTSLCPGVRVGVAGRLLWPPNS